MMKGRGYRLATLDIMEIYGIYSNLLKVNDSRQPYLAIFQMLVGLASG